MKYIISCTEKLIYLIGVWDDSKLQEVAADIPAYFKDSKFLK